MCVQKINVIAIYGASCTGKSTIANIVATKLGWPLRQCGEVVSRKQEYLGRRLSREEHNKIDAETKSLVEETKGGFIVEGAFLKNVIKDNENVLFIELTSPIELRRQRMIIRDGSCLIEERDLDDCELNYNLFEKQLMKLDDVKGSTLRIDTKDMSVEECVSIIIGYIGVW